ncbi:MAG: UDP-3-O-(3-hydroxymyristoyl)glucosamine N-acyltransferase [Nitrospirae bacterium]|nr:UDP-3-O-(3-hydroxymyristoyl)glucosamine N-acyltransferase [Nitrospirota bacterium]MCL5285890.1 UDP-3-O-(3-hydroxymyristoyl)glucosamine N-acyltransferase [Nitrospirota bacterium]
MITLSKIADQVGGVLVGSDGKGEIRSIRPMNEAGPNDLTFLANPKYRKAVPALRAGAILVPEILPEASIPQIIVPSPYLAMALLLQHFFPLPTPKNGISPQAVIDPSARVAENVEIRPGCVVEEGAEIATGTILFAGCVIGAGVRIGEHCILHPRVSILDRVRIGNRVIIQSGAVIGSDGFGYAEGPEGQRLRIPQTGTVVLEDDVEIGANVTIDRATFGETVIGRGTKIDNLVQIAHNVRTGRDCVIVAQAGVSGSTRLGDRVILAGQVGVVGHIEIGSGSMVGAQSGVAQTLPAGSRVSGSPALSHSLWLRIQGTLKNLPSLLRRLSALEKAVFGQAASRDTTTHSEGEDHGTH